MHIARLLLILSVVPNFSRFCSSLRQSMYTKPMNILLVSFGSTGDLIEEREIPVNKRPENLPYYTREIDWNGGKLSFRLPKAGLNWKLDRTDLWLLPSQEEVVAPFFNRKDVLQQMLQENYDTFSSLQSLKPTYALQAMGTGTGKTRLLLEWILQAFNKNDDVIVPFLTKNKTLRAKQFLNLLYYSAYRQYFILTRGENVHLPSGREH